MLKMSAEIKRMKVGQNTSCLNFENSFFIVDGAKIFYESLSAN